MAANNIGRILSAAPNTIAEFPVPTTNSSLQTLTAGPDGNVWFTEGTANKIGKVTPTGEFTEYPIPTANSEPIGIVTGSDGCLWFAEGLGNAVGKATPDGMIVEYPVRTANSRPDNITLGTDGNLWVTENTGLKIAKITTAGTVTEYPIPSGNQPDVITAGPDGTFGSPSAKTARSRRSPRQEWSPSTLCPRPTANRLPSSAGQTTLSGSLSRSAGLPR